MLRLLFCASAPSCCFAKGQCKPFCPAELSCMSRTHTTPESMCGRPADHGCASCLLSSSGVGNQWKDGRIPACAISATRTLMLQRKNNAVNLLFRIWMVAVNSKRYSAHASQSLSSPPRSTDSCWLVCYSEPSGCVFL